MSEVDKGERDLTILARTGFRKITSFFKPRSPIKEIWEKYIPQMQSGTEHESLIYRSQAKAESIDFLVQRVVSESSQVQEQVAQILISRAKEFQREFESGGDEKNRVLAELHIRAAQQIREQLKKV